MTGRSALAWQTASAPADPRTNIIPRPTVRANYDAIFARVVTFQPDQIHVINLTARPPAECPSQPLSRSALFLIRTRWSTLLHREPRRIPRRFIMGEWGATLAVPKPAALSLP